MIDKLIESLRKMNKETFTKQEVELFLELKMKEIEDEPIEFDGVKLIPKNYEVIIDNEKCIFPKKEFKLLYLLISNPGKCITREAILRNCWEDGVIVGDRTIDVHICKIKRKLKGKLDIHYFRRIFTMSVKI